MKYPQNPIIAQINIDSIRNKFETLVSLVTSDMMMMMKVISKLLKIDNLPSDEEAIFIEMNIKNKKWLLCCTYNPNKSLIESHLRQLQKQLEVFSERYEHFIIIGDFNADVSDPSMTSFCTLFKRKSIVKEPTCYKVPENPSCIDSFSTNCPRSFITHVYMKPVSLIFIS